MPKLYTITAPEASFAFVCGYVLLEGYAAGYGLDGAEIHSHHQARHGHVFPRNLETSR